jgi:hypothetical protein
MKYTAVLFALLVGATSFSALAAYDKKDTTKPIGTQPIGTQPIGTQPGITK